MATASSTGYFSHKCRNSLIRKFVGGERIAGPLPLHLKRLERRLEERGGQYFAADRLSVADLKVFVWIRHLKSGALDHVPTDLVDHLAPLLVQHYERIKNEPGVKAYYARLGVAE
jgi:glutathione S-transferase